MANTGKTSGLQTIFSFFLGLMVTAFVGVGTYTFLPAPESLFDTRIEELNRSEQAIRNSKSPDALTSEDREQIRELTEERNELADTVRNAQEVWGRTTSIILIVLATLVMAVSLVRSEQLPVISNGLLMGGVFTMVYGVGWIVAWEPSVARFWVMTVALVITIALGYVRFVRGRPTPVAASEAAAADGVGLGSIEQRVRDLEKRLEEVGRVLGRGSE